MSRDDIWHPCPHCRVNGKYPGQLAGQRVACQACHRPFALPGGPEEIADPAEEFADEIEDEPQPRAASESTKRL